jgi:hypothetical protein
VLYADEKMSEYKRAFFDVVDATANVNVMMKKKK